jgi:hypothetical protein
MKRTLLLCISAILFSPASPAQVMPEPVRKLMTVWFERLQNIRFDPRNHRSLLPDSAQALESVRLPDLPSVLMAVAGLGTEPYAQFVNSGLVIREPEILNSPDFQHETNLSSPSGLWSFPKLMQRTFVALGQPDPAQVEKYFRDWAETSDAFTSRWALENANLRLEAIPLRLLAVVNRLDLGRVDNCPGNQVCGAEFRFVYAGIKLPAEVPEDVLKQNPALKVSRNPYFTVIVEFVLPPVPREQFRAYADSWISLWWRRLSLPLVEKPEPVENLNAVLGELFKRWSRDRAPYVRIRSNLRLSDDMVWQMRQYRLDGTAGMVRAPLDQEPHVNTNQCVAGNSPLGVFVQQKRDIVLKSTHNYYTRPVCGDTELTTCIASLSPFQNKVVTLARENAPASDPSKLDPVRFATSISSCKGCHGVETRGNLPPSDGMSHFADFTQFDQLKYREPNVASALPRFLAGKSSGEPSLIPWQVDPPAIDQCAGDAKVERRYYNDLLRRFLYHLVVATLPVSEWDKTFEAMNLPTWQTH